MLQSRLVHEMLEAAGGSFALFSDYDGTLTPIVEDASDAVLTGEMRARLRTLARHCPVSVVSGRDRDDVRERVGLRELAYAGSHGFDILGPFERFEHRVGEERSGELRGLAAELKTSLAPYPGVLVEEKRFSLAVHFRKAPEAYVPEVKTIVERAIESRSGFAMVEGKKVFDLRPSADWHKGKAVRWLIEALDARTRRLVYLGDDATDELAFAELCDGVTVKVGTGPTRARFRLQDVEAVGRFLDALTNQLVTN